MTMNNQPAKPQRCALYARVSTEEQKEGKNIDSQLAELRSHITTNGWIPAGEYIDDGWSGGLLARPELDRLRDDAEKGIFEAVVVNDVDRLGRDLTNLGVVRRDFERKGVKLLFRKLQNGDSPADSLMVNMMGTFAEFERTLIADRTRRGRRFKAETRQIIVGNIPPYGYRYVAMDKKTGRDGQYIINESEARVVKKVFNWVDHDGLTARGVVRKLTDEKVPTKKGGKHWGKSSVMRLLHNQTYAGITHYNRHKSVESSSAANGRYRRQTKTGRRLRDRSEWISIKLPESLHIITQDQYERVQTQIRNNYVLSSRNSQHNYLLRGLLRCGKCDAPYYGTPVHGKFYYRDGNRIKRFPLPRNCDGASIVAERIETGVWDKLVEAIQSPNIIVKQVAIHEKRLRSVSQDSTSAAEELRRNIAKLQEQEKRVLEAYKLGLIGTDLLKSEMGTNRSEQEKLSAEERELSAKSQVKTPFVEVKKTIKDYCHEVRQKLANITYEQKQAILRLLVQRVVINEGTVKVIGILPAPTPAYEGGIMGMPSGRCVRQRRQ